MRCICMFMLQKSAARDVCECSRNPTDRDEHSKNPTDRDENAMNPIVRDASAYSSTEAA